MYQVFESTLTKEIIGVIFLEAGLRIPFDPANTDYQRYLKWLDGYEEVNGEWVKTSDGNTPLPADQ